MFPDSCRKHLRFRMNLSRIACITNLQKNIGYKGVFYMKSL